MKSSKRAAARSINAQITQGREAAASGGIAVPFFWQRDLDEPDFRGAEQLADRLQFVGPVIVNGADARVDQHLHAMDAGRVGDIDNGVLNRTAIAGGLGNRVDFSVNRAVAILLEVSVGGARFVDEAASVQAVR